MVWVVAVRTLRDGKLHKLSTHNNKNMAIKEVKNRIKEGFVTLVVDERHESLLPASQITEFVLTNT